MEIETQLDNYVLTIRINRPEKKNALTGEMYIAFTTALKEAQENSAVRVVVITGSAQCFSAGNDLQSFLDAPSDFNEAPAAKFIRTLPTLDKPLLAAVEGIAIGVGTTMLLHCDLVVAGESARLHMPFVDLGIVPEAASSLLVPLIVGPRHAAKLLLLGESVDARTAYEMGLVSTVVAPGQAYTTAVEQAQRIAAKPVEAVMAARRLLKLSTRDAALERIGIENEELSKRLQSAETKAIFKALVEKRR
jgi:enoyl-CoA hydratase/carnithine racemase